MPFNSPQVLIVGLIEAILPNHTLRLSDGGFVNWPGRGIFDAKDSLFGTIETIESLTDKLADEAPSGRITFLPSETSGAVALASAQAQSSPMRFWLAEVDSQTGLIVGTPELQFDGLLDTVTILLDQNSRHVEIEFVSAAERLFMVAEGNVLSPLWLKGIFAGDTGLDNATGIAGQVAWGVSGPPRGSASGAISSSALALIIGGGGSRAGYGENSYIQNV